MYIASQVCAGIALVLVIIATQLKKTRDVLIVRLLVTSFETLGLIFFGALPAIIMYSVGIMRGALSIFFVNRDQPKWQWLSMLSLVGVLIGLNVVFWENAYGLFPIFVGIIAVFTFIQKDVRIIQAGSLVASTLNLVYMCIILSPVNIGIEAVTIIFTLIGIYSLMRYRRRNHGMDTF